MKKIDLLFIITLCIFVTLVKYQLGESDQLSQLPLIIKEMDSSYLENDFFVTANEAFGPRFYYSKVMAFGSTIFSIPGWFLLMSLVCCFFTAYFTYLTAQSFFNDEKASLLSAIFVVSLPTPTLALSTFTTYESILTPTALIFPLLVMAFYYFFAKRWIIVPLAIVGVASLIQPLYGLTCGLLIIVAYTGSGWLYNWKDYPPQKMIIGVVVLALFALANIYPYYTSTVSKSISAKEFVDIVAHFRNPHHYVPSNFPITDWILSLFFFGAFIYSLFKFYGRSKTDPHHFQVSFIVLSIIMGFVLGYVFVEVIPNRLFTTAQAFRYVILLKWIACFYLAEWVINDKWRILTSIHPLSLIANVILHDEFEEQVKRYRLPVLLTITVLALTFLRIKEDILVLVAIFLILVYLIYFSDWAIFKKNAQKNTTIGFAIITFFLAISPFISRNILPENFDNLLAKIYPKYDFAYKYDNDLLEMSNFIKDNTPEDAIFLTPPNLPQIRFSANRAIVVDFKSFPYQDQAMLEWRDRMETCFGKTEIGGFPGQEDLAKAFKSADLDHLKTIRDQYNASYAVVDIKNRISENIIFENDSYKVIELKE